MHGERRWIVNAMTSEIKNDQPVYAVVGHDRFLRNETVSGIVASLTDADEGFGPVRVTGDEAVLADVLDELRTMSLLGSRRVVIVDDADGFVSSHRAALERYCGDPAPSASLILACNAMPRTTRLHRVINEIGVVTVCEAPKGRSVISWIVDRARSTYGKRIATDTAASLREHVGDALGSLDTEIGKLATYVGGRDQIDMGDVDALTGHHREEKVFAVTDAIASGDVAQAIRHWEQVLATDRAAPGRAIAGLAWGVRRLLETRRAWEQGSDIRGLARRMYTDPAKLEARLRRVDIDSLEQQQSDLLAADLAVKTGASTLETAVERFIVKHSLGSKALRGSRKARAS